eukprot:TRINITY_DN18118_c0_g1_i1.p1 TRINITY_DN18118_c0_g1~~TRINITY_DN18118_c0_g1_i1.p1  ORF type:complete len:158 (-),score=42.04 TRINITY_DN18118_c0_g1_i1:191-664(-)
MGRVRNKTTKKAARLIIEKYYPRMTEDFQSNKKVADEVAIIPSKRLRNKIAGFATHLMRRIARGPVRGISLKLQEEERDRKDNYVPDVSAIDTSNIEIDVETKAMLRHMEMGNISGITVPAAPSAQTERRDRPRRDRQPNPRQQQQQQGGEQTPAQQ